jgi:ATP-dependent helicase/nuclease subunit A
MTTVGHVMILASAGSGKTYALTNRYVRLLALGAPPERIVALTFTRKAAGEFFDEILNKLGRAAGDPAYARQLAAEIDCAPAPDFLRLLRAVVDAMHRLRLGTLDGFFARIARNFPLELGLTGEFEVLEEHAARVQRARVLRRLFERTGELAPAQREFVEAFKRATFGVEEKRLGAQLDAFLDEHQETFLSAPAAEAWGNPARIWPGGSPWLDDPGDCTAAVQALRAWAETAPLGDKQRGRWQDFLTAWTAWTPGVVPPRPLAYVLEKALEAWGPLAAGTAVLEFDRKRQELSPGASAALRALTRKIVGGELRRRLETTRGIHAVLAGFEAVYHDAVRRAGKLTFGDVQRLLQPGDGAPVLSAAAEAEAGDRLLIDYRLDAEFDHWLLDEFQDTSFGQWSVLRNLIDEVVQDPSGARSFFYVGDVKQAIFAWREGDPRLFREIFDYYNAMRPGSIAEAHLVRSWRSGPPVIETVNRVFGAPAVLATLFPGAAADTWNREWRAHETARPELGGHVAVLHAADEPGRFSATLAILQEIEPLARGLSCAVLVQDNRTAAALADYLRHEGGLPAVAESDLHVCTDNPVGSALLALVQAAAHPGDTLAWRQVEMSPLARVLQADGIRAPEELTRRLLAAIHGEGFERALGYWAGRLEAVLEPEDAFSRERLRQFASAAARFDATGSRHVAEFVQFMERHTVRDADTAAVVRVMTIHKSKGLGFDLVVLADLEGQKLDCRRDGLAVQRSAERSVDWVLDLPGRLFHGGDEVLATHVRAAESDACYEAISLLYVAMTRAKRGLYLVVKPAGKSTSRNYPKLLAETLGEEEGTLRIGRREFARGFAAGDPAWFSGLRLPVAPAGVRAALPLLDRGVAERRARLIARLPSSAKAAEVAGSQLFSTDRSEAADFGTAVHRLLALVGWGGAADASRWAAVWAGDEAPPAAIEEASACLAAPELASVWRAEAGAEVWRERAFEIVIDEAWVSGVFDRVVVRRAPDGRATHATVYDFKTDRVNSDADLPRLAARHAAQLQLYRRVAARLTGLPDGAVDARIVFTRGRRLMPV